MTEPDDCPDLSPVPPMPQDALSAPTGDALLPQILAMLPRGSAWRTDYVADTNDDSFLHRFWRAVAEPMTELYAKSWELALQSTACTVTSALGDWETEFGLPDPCVAVVTDTTDRLAALREKVAGEGGGSIPYFICVAARLGYVIEITEPHFFECGISELLEADQNPDQLASDLQAYWIVSVLNATSEYFEIGVTSSVGYDRLSDYQAATSLECVFRARKPSHTTLIFDYSDTVGGDFQSGSLQLSSPGNFFPAWG